MASRRRTPSARRSAPSAPSATHTSVPLHPLLLLHPGAALSEAFAPSLLPRRCRTARRPCWRTYARSCPAAGRRSPLSSRTAWLVETRAPVEGGHVGGGRAPSAVASAARLLGRPRPGHSFPLSLDRRARILRVRPPSSNLFPSAARHVKQAVRVPLVEVLALVKEARLACTSLASRLHLACTSLASRLHLTCTSLASRLHLHFSPLQLACASTASPPISARCTRACVPSSRSSPSAPWPTSRTIWPATRPRRRSSSAPTSRSREHLARMSPWSQSSCPHHKSRLDLASISA